MRLGDRFTGVVEKCVFGGDGLIRLENAPLILVPGVLPGEMISGVVVAEKVNYLRGRAEEIITPSPDRIEPDCPEYGRCPGCVYREVNFAGEMKIKSAQLADFVRDFEVKILPPLGGGDNPDHYRNKLVLHVHKAGGESFLGYVKSDNVTVNDTPKCLLASEKINAKLAALRADKGFWHSLHEGMDVTFRDVSDGEVLYWRNAVGRNLSWLREKTPFGEISVPPGGFFQVNRAGMGHLCDLLTLEIEQFQVDCFIDLYCGCGLFGAQAAAVGVPKVFGLELDNESAKAAIYNLAKTSSQAEIITGDVAKGLKTALRSIGRKERSMLLVDPPRSGLGKGVIPLLKESGAERIVYISCHPASWRRDALSLEEGGLKLKKVTLVNMFPRTEHFELFSVFER